MLIGVLIFGSSKSPTFTDPSTIFYLGINTGYIAIMALPMTFVVMTGEIDLSVASMLGLSGATVGYLWHHGWGIWPAFAVALRRRRWSAARSTACWSRGSGCRRSPSPSAR